MEQDKPELLEPRQWWLYRLIKASGEKLSIADIVNYQNEMWEQGKLTYSNLYQFKETEGNHSNCPAIYQDIDTINECEELDKIIVKKNNQFWIGNEQETIQYHNRLMHNVCRDSHKAKRLREKISQEGQGKLFTYDLVPMSESEGRDYHETFLKNETLAKELEKTQNELKEFKKQTELLIKELKNENKMWKERYYAK